jgi:hypothetical protein
MNKAPSQNAIGRGMKPPMSSANMVKLKKQGCPMDSVEAAQSWWETNTNIASRKKAPAPDEHTNTHEPDEDHSAARTRREISEANISQMREADLAGKFLGKSEVDSAVFEIARAMRDGLTNCARRIAADVATLTNAEACEAVIDREHRALLESMAHSLHTKLGAKHSNG